MSDFRVQDVEIKNYKGVYLLYELRYRPEDSRGGRDLCSIKEQGTPAVVLAQMDRGSLRRGLRVVCAEAYLVFRLGV